MKVSVIATVLNEANSIERLLDSLAAQTRRPDEVVIVDGGSRDGTVDAIERFADRLPLIVLTRPGANISQGRNAAIRAATGEIICSADAGTGLEPRWVEELAAPIEAGRAQAAAGWFMPEVHTPFEVALAATTLPERRDVDPLTFLPSSRSVAYRKAAWEAAGGYPEWLDYCEDLILDFALQDRFGPFAFAPEAIAHFRPRSSLRAFARQYYRYCRGDGKADLWRKRQAARYATYLVGLPLVIVGALTVHPLCGLLLVPGAWAMLWAPYRRLGALWGRLSRVERLQAALWVPVVRVTGDLAKMAGYPAGVAWRLRHRSAIPDHPRR